MTRPRIEKSGPVECRATSAVSKGPTLKQTQMGIGGEGGAEAVET